MLRLRPYKPCDASAIVSWIGDEIAFRKWCADRFAAYPITAEDLNRHYDAMADSDSFFEMTAFDESGPVGHLILRFTDEKKTVVRFGFVIVDAKKRGKGYGKEAMNLLMAWAFEDAGAHRGFLDCKEYNDRALHVYESVGLQREGVLRDTIFVDGKYENLVVLGILEHEWRGRKNREG